MTLNHSPPGHNGYQAPCHSRISGRVSATGYLRQIPLRKPPRSQAPPNKPVNSAPFPQHAETSIHSKPELSSGGWSDRDDRPVGSKAQDEARKRASTPVLGEVQRIVNTDLPAERFAITKKVWCSQYGVTGGGAVVGEIRLSTRSSCQTLHTWRARPKPGSPPGYCLEVGAAQTKWSLLARSCTSSTSAALERCR
jgi:hypothetical protein